MAKVITFSRVFPATHPRKGEPTYFREKILHTLLNLGKIDFKSDYVNNVELNLKAFCSGYKNHTIRAGHRFKVGDYFSPRVWSGKPYNSKQIVIAPDIEIKKVWDFTIDLNCVYSINGKYTSEQTDYDLALNDGLTESDMQFWFMPNMNKPKEFDGQIICWNENINY